MRRMLLSLMLLTTLAGATCSDDDPDVGPGEGAHGGSTHGHDQDDASTAPSEEDSGTGDAG
jgi:hypothetical protein